MYYITGKMMCRRNPANSFLFVLFIFWSVMNKIVFVFVVILVVLLLLRFSRKKIELP